MLAGVATCADGFLTKCLNQGQLRSRLHAVQRIISQETTLAVLNAMLSRAHQQIASDLQAFAAMQRKLLTSYGQTIDGLHADGLFVTPAYMSDDLLNYVLLDAYHPAFYGVDVAGHGVSAAMLVQEFYSASLIHSQRFSPSVQRSVLPYRVVSERNRRFPQAAGGWRRALFHHRGMRCWISTTARVSCVRAGILPCCGSGRTAA